MKKVVIVVRNKLYFENGAVCELMTVAVFLERLPIFARDFPELSSCVEVARSYSDDDTVRLSFDGRKLVIDFLACDRRNS